MKYTYLIYNTDTKRYYHGGRHYTSLFMAKLVINRYCVHMGGTWVVEEYKMELQKEHAV